jgi:hypothetical protein
MNSLRAATAIERTAVGMIYRNENPTDSGPKNSFGMFWPSLSGVLMLHTQLRILFRKTLPLIILAWCASVFRVQSQGINIAVTTSTNIATLGQNFSYVVSFTSITNLILANVVISNAYPASTTFVGATATNGTLATNTAIGAVYLSVPTVFTGEVAQVTITVQPTTGAILTNIATAYVRGIPIQVVTNITQVFAGTADLQVRLAGKTSGVLTNDVVPCQVTVDNLGPASAAAVTLSVAFPAGFQLLTVRPAAQAYSVTNQTVYFAWDSLAANAQVQFWLNLQATNAPTNSFPVTNVVSANISTTGSIDPNAANNLASLSVVVGTPLPGNLNIAIEGIPQFNPQTALMEQIVHLSASGTNVAPAARLLVLNSPYQVYNAAGTNSGVPYLNVDAPVDSTGVDVLVRYFDPHRSLSNSPSFSLFPVAPTSYVLPLGTVVAYIRRDAGGVGPAIIEFPATTSASYSIIYGDDAAFDNGLLVEPAIIAPGDKVLWFDKGLPETRSSSTNAPMRFYRVIANP